MGCFDDFMEFRDEVEKVKKQKGKDDMRKHGLRSDKKVHIKDICKK